ncbi:MAG: hypothetical protein FAZ92_02793 [Accumulibacter sp.]|nr:MAG: hypothetical protein FAZ92_02793 [Accumulibacter sp.]
MSRQRWGIGGVAAARLPTGAAVRPAVALRPAGAAAGGWMIRQGEACDDPGCS